MLFSQLVLAQGSSGGGAGIAPEDLAASALAGVVTLVWTDGIGDNTGYGVERADGEGGFVEIDTVGADIETYEDVGPFVEGVRYRYRLAVVGGALDGEHSNVAGVTPLPSPASGGRLQIGFGISL